MSIPFICRTATTQDAAAAPSVTASAAAAQPPPPAPPAAHPADVGVHGASPYASCHFHQWYGGVWGYPSGESSHSSWRPSAVMSR